MWKAPLLLALVTPSVAVGEPLHAAASAAASPSASFGAPWLIHEAPWPAYFVGFGALGERVAAGSLGGATCVKNLRSGDDSHPWAHDGGGGGGIPSVPALAQQTFPSQMPNAVEPAQFTFGKFIPQLSGTETATQFNATGGARIALDAAGTTLTQEPLNRTTTFEALPKPIQSAKFTVGGFRLGGAAGVRLPHDGSILQTIIVTFAGQEHLPYPEATSIVLFRSFDDGASWKFVTVMADAKDYPHSEEGPNEMDMTLLADGKTLLAVVRVDGGDGPVTHPYRNYVQLTSADAGATWTAPESMPGTIGCARPRLLRVGQALVLSGGRMRNANTSDVIMWLDRSGMAAISNTTWEEFSLSYHHNLGVAARYNSSLEYDANVNSTTFSPRETNSYTSLIQLDSSSAMVTYDLILGKGEQLSFSMVVDLGAAKQRRVLE